MLVGLLLPLYWPTGAVGPYGGGGRGGVRDAVGNDCGVGGAADGVGNTGKMKRKSRLTNSQ